MAMYHVQFTDAPDTRQTYRHIEEWDDHDGIAEQFVQDYSSCKDPRVIHRVSVWRDGEGIGAARRFVVKKWVSVHYDAQPDDTYPAQSDDANPP